MTFRLSCTLAAAVALGACTANDRAAILADPDRILSYENATVQLNRLIADNYQDQPFAEGRVYLVAEEHGELHTYSLTPCHGATRICGGSGGVGHVQQTPDYVVVTGAYPGRVFYLSPGGDGYLKWRGEFRDLAWN